MKTHVKYMSNMSIIAAAVYREVIVIMSHVVQIISNRKLPRSSQL